MAKQAYFKLRDKYEAKTSFPEAAKNQERPRRAGAAKLSSSARKVTKN
jgi:hypothetical protein